MNILLLGKTGQLGWDLQRTLITQGNLFAPSHQELDLTRHDDVTKYILDVKPDVIINAAAYTNVDKAESEPNIAAAINSTTPGLLAELALKHQSALIHFSTDYVFDGNQTKPYIESDQTNPINLYGRSKLSGEHHIQQIGGAYFIFRTSWVYSLHHDCFVTKILNLAKSQKSLRVVKDQTGSPTWSRMLAEITGQIIAIARHDLYHWILQKQGIYHLAGDGSASRYEFSLKILEHNPFKKESLYESIEPVESSSFTSPARRPSFSALNCDLFKQTFELGLPAWEQNVSLALAEIV